MLLWMMSIPDMGGVWPKDIGQVLSPVRHIIYLLTEDITHWIFDIRIMLNKKELVVFITLGIVCFSSMHTHASTIVYSG